MKKILRQTATILACMCVFAACSDDDKNEESITISVNKTSLDMKVGDVEVITASPTGETFVWTSDNTAVATVSGGTVTAVGPGVTSIVVSCRDAKKTIPVTVTERIPVTGIDVSPTSLTLTLAGTPATLTASLLPANNTEGGTIVWQSSHPAVAAVADGVVTAVGAGAATITAALEGNPAIKTEIPVTVSAESGLPVVDVTTFQESGVPNVVYGQVAFEQNGQFTITGISADEIAAAYNRDFFDYNSETGGLTFTGETGTWDVFYSARYHYFWVGRMDGAYPDAVWILGCGFSCPPVWHSDFGTLGWWSHDDIRMLAYMKNLGNNRYQATIYINSPGAISSDDGECDIEFYEYRTQKQAEGQGSPMTANPTLTGDVTGFNAFARGMYSYRSSVNAYYRITLDLSGGWGAASLHVEQLND